MAKLVFGLNQSLDGYVDHQAMVPDTGLFRHFRRRAEVFSKVNGQDQKAYILSVNLNRRHMPAGTRAAAIGTAIKAAPAASVGATTRAPEACGLKRHTASFKHRNREQPLAVATAASIRAPSGNQKLTLRPECRGSTQVRRGCYVVILNDLWFVIAMLIGVVALTALAFVVAG